ncbi:MAG: DUF4270 domain-containing protein [Bacteroidales bacterium]|nr:DUF4270 domain-containing protein [Bacteroidales bacterium]
MNLSTFRFFALATLALWLGSCTKDENKIGLDILPPGEELLLSYTDTITAVVYSYREDSVRTDELSTSLLGSYFDPVFGKTTASVFTEIRLSTVKLDFGEGAVIDSLILKLAYQNVYGDSSTVQTFRVFELTENINIDSAYFSNQMSAYQASELGSVTMAPLIDSILVDTVKVAPYLRIPLNQAMANKLLSADSTHFESNEKFVQFFKGLYITADPVNMSGQGALLTYNLLSTASSLTAYYHNNEKDSLQYTFSITSASARYSHYEHYDYADADQLFRQQVIDGDTALGSEKVYLQALGGVRTYLRFPGLSTLGSQIGSGNRAMISVNEAQLIFNLQETSPAVSPPSRIIIGKNVDADGTTTVLADQIEGESYFGGFYESDSLQYRFRLSRYVQQTLLKPDEDEFGLVLLIPNASFAPQRVILNGGASETGRIKLAITYTIVE